MPKRKAIAADSDDEADAAPVALASAKRAKKDKNAKQQTVTPRKGASSSGSMGICDICKTNDKDTQFATALGLPEVVGASLNTPQPFLVHSDPLAQHDVPSI